MHPYFKLHASKPVVGFSLALDIIVLDQLSKWLIVEYILRPEVQPHGTPRGLLEWIVHPPSRLPHAGVEILPFFNLTMVWNEGISFGLFQGMGSWLLIALALIIVALFSGWLMRAKFWLPAISLSLVIGGALGNVIDRLRFGGVADFFDFHIGTWHYPAFNVADCCVVAGIALLALDGIFFEFRRNKEALPS